MTAFFYLTAAGLTAKIGEREQMLREAEAAGRTTEATTHANAIELYRTRIRQLERTEKEGA